MNVKSVYFYWYALATGDFKFDKFRIQETTKYDVYS